MSLLLLCAEVVDVLRFAYFVSRQGHLCPKNVLNTTYSSVILSLNKGICVQKHVLNTTYSSVELSPLTSEFRGSFGYARKVHFGILHQDFWLAVGEGGGPLS